MSSEITDCGGLEAVFPHGCWDKSARFHADNIKRPVPGRLHGDGLDADEDGRL